MNIHITGNGQQALHERGTQLLYSPFMSFSIGVKEDESYGFFILWFPIQQITEVEYLAAKKILDTDFLHPRFISAAAAIMDRRKTELLFTNGMAASGITALLPISGTVGISLLKDLVDPPPETRFQGKYITLEQARTFYDQKNDLLAISNNRLPIHELMSAAGIKSVKSFKRLAKQIYGLTLPELVLESRMIWAATLLRENRYTIKHIAVNVGFANVYHFTRAFKRYFGIPPGVYKRKFGL